MQQIVFIEYEQMMHSLISMAEIKMATVRSVPLAKEEENKKHKIKETKIFFGFFN